MRLNLEPRRKRAGISFLILFPRYQVTHIPGDSFHVGPFWTLPKEAGFICFSLSHRSLLSAAVFCLRSGPAVGIVKKQGMVLSRCQHQESQPCWACAWVWACACTGRCAWWARFDFSIWVSMYFHRNWTRICNTLFFFSFQGVKEIADTVTAFFRNRKAIGLSLLSLATSFLLHHI